MSVEDTQEHRETPELRNACEVTHRFGRTLFIMSQYCALLVHEAQLNNFIVWPTTDFFVKLHLSRCLKLWRCAIKSCFCCIFSFRELLCTHYGWLRPHKHTHFNGFKNDFFFLQNALYTMSTHICVTYYKPTTAKKNQFHTF